MARTQFDAVWRGLERVVDVLDTNLATTLTANTPAGLNTSAVASGSYYALGSERAVREHQANGNPLCYVYPVGRQRREGRTQGTTTRPTRLFWQVAIAFRLHTELGAADYVASWKTLEPPGREYYRLEVLLGSACDVIDEHVRNGDDIHEAHFDSRTTDIDLSPNVRGTWGQVIYDVKQEIDVKVQNTSS